jgi:hypothetical protein
MGWDGEWIVDFRKNLGITSAYMAYGWAMGFIWRLSMVRKSGVEHQLDSEVVVRFLNIEGKVGSF